MKKKLALISFVALLSTFAVGAEEIKVNSFRHAGPYPVVKPFMVDSVDVNSKPFDVKKFLDTPLSDEALKDARTVSGEALPGYDGGTALHWAGFPLQSSAFAKAKIKVEGLSVCKTYVDGKETKGETSLAPGTHEVSIKYLSESGKAETLSVTVSTESEGKISLTQGGKHLYGMKDVLLGTRFSGVEVSPDGDYMIVSYKTTFEGGRSESTVKLVELATGKAVCVKENIRWMPVSKKY